MSICINDLHIPEVLAQHKAEMRALNMAEGWIPGEPIRLSGPIWKSPLKPKDLDMVNARIARDVESQAAWAEFW